MAKPKQPDNRKTLGEIRAALTYDDCSMVRAIARLYKEIAAANPQALIDVMNARGSYLSTLDAERQASMVQFYADNAEYLMTLFDHK